MEKTVLFVRADLIHSKKIDQNHPQILKDSIKKMKEVMSTEIIKVRSHYPVHIGFMRSSGDDIVIFLYGKPDMDTTAMLALHIAVQAFTVNLPVSPLLKDGQYNGWFLTSETLGQLYRFQVYKCEIEEKELRRCGLRNSTINQYRAILGYIFSMSKAEDNTEYHLAIDEEIEKFKGSEIGQWLNNSPVTAQIQSTEEYGPIKKFKLFYPLRVSRALPINLEDLTSEINKTIGNKNIGYGFHVMRFWVTNFVCSISAIRRASLVMTVFTLTVLLIGLSYQEIIVYNFFLKKESAASISDFLENYPNSKYRQELDVIREKILCENLEKNQSSSIDVLEFEKSISAYKQYYPKGKCLIKNVELIEKYFESLSIDTMSKKAITYDLNRIYEHQMNAFLNSNPSDTVVVAVMTLWLKKMKLLAVNNKLSSNQANYILAMNAAERLLQIYPSSNQYNRYVDFLKKKKEVNDDLLLEIFRAYLFYHPDVSHRARIVQVMAFYGVISPISMNESTISIELPSIRGRFTIENPNKPNTKALTSAQQSEQILVGLEAQFIGIYSSKVLNKTKLAMTGLMIVNVDVDKNGFVKKIDIPNGSKWSRVLIENMKRIITGTQFARSNADYKISCTYKFEKTGN